VHQKYLSKKRENWTKELSVLPYKQISVVQKEPFIDIYKTIFNTGNLEMGIFS